MSLTKEQLEKLKDQSGTQGGGVRLPVLNRIQLNGNCDAVEDDKGVLKRPPVNYRKMMLTTVSKEDERPENVDLGSPIELIFIKVRRRLVARDSNGFQIMSTSQHSQKSDIVTLWSEGKMIEQAPAGDLREKYDNLRTIQEVYALMGDELVLLIVKGASLGSKTRDEKYPSFYEYIQSISGDGIFAHTTKLGGVLEKGKKDFYTMTFEKGKKTTDTQLEKILKHSDTLTELITEYDKENAKKRNVEPQEDDVTIEPFVEPADDKEEEIAF